MISSLIIKYLNGEASENEVELIFEWINKSHANKKEFMTLKKAWLLTESTKTDTKIAWKSLQKEIAKTQTFKHKTWLKYAAIVVLLISVGRFTWSSLNKKQEQPNGIVLEVENTSINLNENKADVTTAEGHVIAKQNNNEIIYKAAKTATNLEYHTLKIPLGKTFNVTLSDGTKVHLNAGTTFKYPKQFSNTGNRLVYLNGEAFFEVEKDKAHPFIVNINDIDVKVLGTKFNVNAYPENSETSCVLVEGSVELSNINNPNNKSLLTPNHKATWNATTETFKQTQVNTHIYTSWIHGEIILDSAHFSSFSKKLERAFNVKITNNNTLLEAQEFSGTINFKTSTLEDILDLLKFDTFFEYSIEDNQIIISNN
ncbi:FecR family protein [Algibacter sp. Ld11]|uniref:FecR family protein n=1 Tax=Algibacter sp. Ld11 TaxID=649150 RepID=UPI00386D7279